MITKKKKFTIKQVKYYLTRTRNKQKKKLWKRLLETTKKQIKRTKEKLRIKKQKDRIKQKTKNFLKRIKQIAPKTAQALKKRKVQIETKQAQTKRISKKEQKKLIKRTKGKGKITDKFKPKTITEEQTDLSKIKHAPTKSLKRMLGQALKPEVIPRKGQIARQEEKFKHFMEYDVEVWGESNGQIILITQFTDKNKTIKKLKQQLQEVGIQEDNTIEDTKLYTDINPKLNIQASWLPTTKTAIITKVKINMRIIKG